MSFRLIPKEQHIKWPVTVVEQDNGQRTETLITIHYQFQPDYRKTKLVESVVGWEGVLDGDGNPLPFSPENRDLLFSHHAAALAVEAGWLALIRGEHLRKN